MEIMNKSFTCASVLADFTLPEYVRTSADDAGPGWLVARISCRQAAISDGVFVYD